MHENFYNESATNSGRKSRDGLIYTYPSKSNAVKKGIESELGGGI